MKVSVLTVTNRYGGIDIAVAGLVRQAVRDFEWVLVDALFGERWAEVAEYAGEAKIAMTHLADPPKQHINNLASALNVGLAHCRGDYVVLLQDYIWIPRHGLQRFLDMQAVHGPALITGVGNIGAAISAQNESGLITIYGEPYDGPPPGLSWADPRKSWERGVHPCEPVAWEQNWACLPRSVAGELGGFDEEYDHGWAWEHVELAERARLAGYPVLIDMENEVKGFRHEDNPLKRQREIDNATRCAKDIQRLRDGEKPIKTPYLERRRAECLSSGT